MILNTFVVLLAILYANFVEWFAHKYILHGLGQDKNSPLSFHWHRHHKTSRFYNMLDIDYEKPFWHKNRFQEPLILTILVILHSWLLFIFPVAFAVMVCYSIAYYFIHKMCHTDIEFAKKYFPWHRRHHMKGNQSFNWCVVFPLMDILLETYRGKYE